MNETKISIIRKNPVFTSDKILKVFNYEVKDNYKKISIKSMKFSIRLKTLNSIDTSRREL